MQIFYNGNENTPEIDFRGTCTEWVAFGRRLIQGCSELIITSVGPPSKFYPVQLKCVNILCDENVADPYLWYISLEEDVLKIISGFVGLRNLGQSCINLFEDAEDGTHWHLDYFEGNLHVAETKCHLILHCVNN